MCALCRRNLLAGERYRRWDQADVPRTGRPVCYLCEDEAARAGWIRSEQVVLLRERATGLGVSVRMV